MRVNVYSQELTGEVQCVETISDTGKSYGGVRVVLHSSPRLHHTGEDDDRSGVTFWFPSADAFGMAELAYMFVRMANLTMSSTQKIDPEAMLALKTEIATLNRLLNHATMPSLPK
jgi:hypothetical protein